jgi:hypothetical protein
MGRKFGFSFSWKRALGLSAAKGKVSRAIGIPLTKSGRQRKAGRLLGDLVGTAVVAGTQLAVGSGSITREPQVDSTVTQDYRLLIRAIRLGDAIESVWQNFPGLSWLEDSRTGGRQLTDGRGLRVLSFRDRVYAIQISFGWQTTWEELVNVVAVHLSVPGDAPWEEESSQSGFWLNGDQQVSVSLTNNDANVSVSIKSVVSEVVALLGGREKLESIVIEQKSERTSTDSDAIADTRAAVEDLRKVRAAHPESTLGKAFRQAGGRQCQKCSLIYRKDVRFCEKCGATLGP